MRTGYVKDGKAIAAHPVLLLFQRTPLFSFKRPQWGAVRRNLKFSCDLGEVQKVLRFEYFFKNFNLIGDRLVLLCAQNLQICLLGLLLGDTIVIVHLVL